MSTYISQHLTSLFIYFFLKFLLLQSPRSSQVSLCNTNKDKDNVSQDSNVREPEALVAEGRGSLQ